MPGTDDFHDVHPDDSQQFQDTDWFGSRTQRRRTVEQLRFERDAVERIHHVEAQLPPDTSRAALPRAVELRPRPRLIHRDENGEQDADPLFIINNDDRVVYNDWRYPWGVTCLIESDEGSGSGVLVGPRHVLTASHVINWGENTAISVDVHSFDGVSRARAWAATVAAYTEVTPGEDSSYTDEDYAVIVLDQRLGDSFGWMGSRTYDSSWDEEELWTTIGYAGDVASMRRPLYQQPFYLDEDALDYGWGRAMSTNADLYYGQSGSPIFSWWDGSPYVVAVVAAQVGDENYCAGGTGLPSLVGAVRDKLP